MALAGKDTAMPIYLMIKIWCQMQMPALNITKPPFLRDSNHVNVLMCQLNAMSAMSKTFHYKAKPKNSLLNKSTKSADWIFLGAFYKMKFSGAMKNVMDQQSANVNDVVPSKKYICQLNRKIMDRLQRLMFPFVQPNK